MHRNHLLFSLFGLLAVACALPNDRRPFVRVITEPKPGEEYVSIHTGMPSSAIQGRHLESDMDVKILDEGQTGIKEVAGSVPLEEKIYAHKKLYPSNEDGQRRSKAEKKYAAPVDTDDVSPDSFVAKPNKLKNKREEEIITQSPSKVQDKMRNNNKEDDGLFDFVDSPYGNQPIVGSASSQASRVNIKKAPNGQEYEYEYVYYYYDEDEEHAKPGSKTSQSSSNTPPTSSKPNKDVKENNSKSKKPSVVQDENQFVQNTNKGRFSVDHTVTTEEPEGHANFAVNDIAEHNSKTKESGRNLEEALSVPSSSLPVSEERLPHNPRFPVRSRGNSKPAQEIATTAAPATDTPITRIRANNNNGPHQPGLDLVDSNAFRTHSGNGQHAQATSPRHESHRGSTDKGAVDLYAILQQTRSEETANTILSSEHSTRFEDSETQYPTTLRLAPTTTTTTTTQAPTTTTTTTTTTTQAPAPARQAPGSGPVRSRYRGGAGGTRNTVTSTTTTTTEQPPSEEVTEKRKFKPTRERNTQGSVYSKRYQSSTAALDKESSTAESEVVTKAQKPSFGRQRTRASKPISTSTVQIDENVEVTSVAPKPNFAERSNLRRQNSRNKFTTSASTTSTAAPVQQVTEENESNVSEHEVSEPTTTTAKAIGGRLRPNIRPLRPGLRLNFGGKGSSTTAVPVPSTTQAPIVESSPEEVEEKELVQETSPTPTPDTLSRLKNKSRFRVPEKQGPLAPKQQTLAPPATGQNRKHLLSNLLPKKKSIQTEEPPVLEDVKPVLENEQENDQGAELQNEEDIDRQQSSSTTTSTTEAPPSSTNKLSSLLKRRPLQRRPAVDLPSRQSNQDE
ncbi:mucin-5AC-like isoform X2 [Myzus persicae]|uniref:mucin-5AC-like isoform X2 n=1 Tax=Myzus persicae TaxID=13164 RepID=UPI000B9351B7|nr:mucin-5AC-like isoform X2 [Myzus persicae]